MPSIPRITPSDIINWTDNTYFQRGQKYYEQAQLRHSKTNGVLFRI